MFVLQTLVGVAMLVYGANLLVKGGGQLALALRVPALVVGLTIVAFGTSAPELLVSVTAALKASTEMALANVNGSNIANILLVLGLAAMITPLSVDRSLMRRDVPSCLALQLMVPLVAWNGVISRLDGILLLGLGVGYNTWLLYDAMRGRAPPMDDELDDASPHGKIFHLGQLVGGILILVVGANIFVTGATGIAQWFGLSDRFIGLSVVALGTSAPEVFVAVVGASKGEVELAVGNSLGSNILNIAMVLGITAIIAPIQITDAGAWSDLAAAVAATALLLPIVFSGTLGRLGGGLMASVYIAYMAAGLVA